MAYDYRNDYLERQKREEQAHRNYWGEHAAKFTRENSPYQGPDKLGRTLKCGMAGGELSRWTYTAPPKLKTWKPALKPTTATTAHVELSQRVFVDPSTGWEFTFWALAPRAHRLSREEAAHTEWVWVILDAWESGRGVHHALVDLDTGDLLWWNKTCGHHVKAA